MAILGKADAQGLNSWLSADPDPRNNIQKKAKGQPETLGSARTYRTRSGNGP